MLVNKRRVLSPLHFAQNVCHFPHPVSYVGKTKVGQTMHNDEMLLELTRASARYT